MTSQHDNHSRIEEMFDELLRDTASRQPTDEQWRAAHGRLRRRLAEASMNAQSGKRGLPFLRIFAYACGAAAVLALIAIPILFMGGRDAVAAAMNTPGQLVILNPDGSQGGLCPLEHTDVNASIAGFITRVRVKQSFQNPYDRPIEAVYEFPLPQGSAVDEMKMRIGSRVLIGMMKEKEEARRIYVAARAAGERTALLEQKRPNIFQQSVANIQPGERIEIEIGYNEVLSYVDGRFEFVFPMVIAPRYDPRTVSTDVARAPSPAMTPHGAPIQTTYADMTTTAPATRSGHDISVTVTIASGNMQLDQLASRLHDIDIERPGLNTAVVRLKNKTDIPNRDFVLDYNIIGDEIGDALFTRDDPKHGRFFSVTLAPPKRVTPKNVVPRELIFVLDRSGSMNGWKIEKAKLAMRQCIKNLNPGDTFNVLSFSNGLEKWFPAAIDATPENINAALAILDTTKANGGTQMMPAILEALSNPTSDTRTRIVGFMSDGEVGNDFEILSAVKQNAGTTRVFTFGVGNSVNRFLLDTMARTARGEAQFVTEKDSPEAAADRFYVSVSAPVLSDVKLDWQGIQVEDVTPALLPDLFDRRPVMIHGKIKAGSPTTGTLTLSGITGAGPFRRVIRIPADAVPTENAALPSLWARSRVDQIMIDNPVEIRSGQFSPATRERIIGLGVEYNLMTQFTSFVAVEKNPFAPKATPIRIDVAAAKPKGEPEETIAIGSEKADRKTIAVGIESYHVDTSRYPAQAPAPSMVVGSRPGPTISDLLDIHIGDSKNSAANNGVFIHPNAYNLDDFTHDDMTAASAIIWTFAESGTHQPYANNKPTASAPGVDNLVGSVATKDNQRDPSDRPTGLSRGPNGLPGSDARYNPTNGTTTYGDVYKYKDSGPSIGFVSKVPGSGGVQLSGPESTALGLDGAKPAANIKMDRARAASPEKSRAGIAPPQKNADRVHGDEYKARIGEVRVLDKSGARPSESLKAASQKVDRENEASDGNITLKIQSELAPAAVPMQKGAVVQRQKYEGAASQRPMPAKSMVAPAESNLPSVQSGELIGKVQDKIPRGPAKDLKIDSKGAREFKADNVASLNESVTGTKTATQSAREQKTVLSTNGLAARQIAQESGRGMSANLTQVRRAWPTEEMLPKLMDQLTSGRLTARQIDTITSKALAIQADPKQPWTGAWGDWIEKARSLGKVADADYQKYAEQTRSKAISSLIAGKFEITVNAVAPLNRKAGWTLRVNSDRKAHLTINAYPKTIERDFEIPQKQFDQLKQALIDEKYFDLADSYGESVPDGRYTTMTVVAGDAKKTVRIAYPMNWINADKWKLVEPSRAIRILMIVREWFNDPQAVDMREYDRKILDAANKAPAKK